MVELFYKGKPVQVYYTREEAEEYIGMKIVNGEKLENFEIKDYEN